MKTRVGGMTRWFLAFGAIGLLVALAIAILASHRATYRLIRPSVVMTLWPASVIGIVDPTDTSSQIVFGLIEFGGNFLLYGVVGVFFGTIIRGISRVLRRNNP
jgi:hypothetical protein